MEEPNTKRSSNDAVPIMAMSSDLMVEILIRLPDCKSALRCTAVCKHWLPLVTDPTFRLRFTEHHRQLKPRKKLASDILFRTHTYLYDEGIPQPSDSFNYSSPASRRSDEAASSSTMSFLPGWPLVTVQSSSGDLLLVELHRDDDDFNNTLYICNPLTKRWTSIPDPPPRPPDSSVYYGLTLQSSTSSWKYRVVAMVKTQGQRPQLAVFRSENGQWDQSFGWFQIDPNHDLHRESLPGTRITTLNRFIFFPVRCRMGAGFGKLAVIDTFSEPLSFRLLELPRTGSGTMSWRRKYRYSCIGEVQGRLRLSMSHHLRDSVDVKIWELKEYDYDNNVASWVLARKVWVENVSSKFDRLGVRAFHPRDDDVLFIVDRYGNCVWKYHIGRGTFEKIGDVTGAYVVHAVVHPFWPTPIPSLE